MSAPFDIVQQEQAVMAWTKEGLKTFLIPGLADNLVKIYDPIISFTLKEKSEQVGRTTSPIPDLCLLARDLPIQEYDPEIGTERNSLIDSILATFPQVLKTMLQTSEEEWEPKDLERRMTGYGMMIPTSPSSRTT
jgi:hypothetical protein